MAAHDARAQDGARLEVEIEVPSRGVALTLTPRPGRVTAVIGPNGAGKSTLLGAVAGSVRARGSIRLDGEEILPLPPHRRHVTHLRQDPLLFEHLRVVDNVAFGPRSQGVPAPEARSRALSLLADLGIEDLADRRPRRISGGQAQRVAIARALAAEPRLMLLDEPFAALDASAGARLRGLAAGFLSGRTALLVTHDLIDVLSLADDVAVLDAGRVVQHGARGDVLARPRTAFAAHLIGKEVIRGTILESRGERAVLETEDGRHLEGIPEDGLRVGEAARLLLDPAQVQVQETGPEHSDPGPGLLVRIEALDRRGGAILLRGGGLAAQVPADRILDGRLAIGSTVRMLLPPEHCLLYADAGDHEPAPRP